MHPDNAIDTLMIIHLSASGLIIIITTIIIITIIIIITSGHRFCH